MANGEVSEHELQEHFLDFSSDQLKIVVNRMIKGVLMSILENPVEIYLIGSPLLYELLSVRR